MSSNTLWNAACLLAWCILVYHTSRLCICSKRNIFHVITECFRPSNLKRPRRVSPKWVCCHNENENFEPIAISAVLLAQLISTNR